MTDRLAEDLDFSRRNLRQDDSDATNAMTRHVKFIFSAKLFHMIQPLQHLQRNSQSEISDLEKWFRLLLPASYHVLPTCNYHVLLNVKASLVWYETVLLDRTSL